MINYRRLSIATLFGALLGILCIVGVGGRVGFSGNWLYLFSMWYNRLVMGVLIGLAGGFVIIKDERYKWINVSIRGLIFGLFITSAHFLSTEFRDIPSFFAGLAYGLIIDLGATFFGEK